MPHFRVKIGKMHHFCLNLEILGGGPGSRLLIGVVVVKLTLEGGLAGDGVAPPLSISCWAG